MTQTIADFIFATILYYFPSIFYAELLTSNLLHFNRNTNKYNSSAINYVNLKWPVRAFNYVISANQGLNLFMKYSAFYCFLFFLTPFISTGQSKNYTLNGLITVEDGETFTYKIVFTDSANVINGYSLTYLQKNNETKAAIVGTIDREKRTLSFRETNIIYTQGYQSKMVMCLIDAKLKYTHSNNGNVLTGSLVSNEADNTACAKGTITFYDDNALRAVFGKEEKMDTTIVVGKHHSDDTKPIIVAVPAAKPLVTDKVTAGKGKAYDWHTDTIVIDIWDGGHIDGDMVTLLYNEKPILNNYVLTAQKKRLSIPISGSDINTLTIVAENEGSEPSNTASMMLMDGNTKYSILAYDKAGERAVINIKKVADK